MGSVYFNPRSPCGERHWDCYVGDHKLLNFNPRSPCGERHYEIIPLRYFEDFNPRSPCGERLIFYEKENERKKISIHAPRVGSDNCRKAGATL